MQSRSYADHAARAMTSKHFNTAFDVDLVETALPGGTSVLVVRRSPPLTRPELTS